MILRRNGELTLADLSGTGDAYIGADTDGKLKRMDTPCRFMGFGTSFPTTGNQEGDIYYHTVDGIHIYANADWRSAV